MRKKKIHYKIGDKFNLSTGELARIKKVEDDDKKMPETKPLRDTFNISAINYLIEVEGREGTFRINQNDIDILKEYDEAENFDEKEIDLFLKDMKKKGLI